MATGEMEINPERLGKSAQMLKLFEKMEDKGIVSYTSKELPDVV